VLDLFAGTGALGIEALSRGAAGAVFVERAPAALAVLRANLAALELGPDVAEVRRADALDALRAARAGGEKYDLVFVDPPYREAQLWQRQLPPLLAPLLSAGALVVAESDRRAPLELAPDPWRTRHYGDTAISIHRHQ
jgi:16S rRNA (guanine966-N2)-methyltransferase